MAATSQKLVLCRAPERPLRPLARPHTLRGYAPVATPPPRASRWKLPPSTHNIMHHEAYVHFEPFTALSRAGRRPRHGKSGTARAPASPPCFVDVQVSSMWAGAWPRAPTWSAVVSSSSSSSSSSSRSIRSRPGAGGSSVAVGMPWRATDAVYHQARAATAPAASAHRASVGATLLVNLGRTGPSRGLELARPSTVWRAGQTGWCTRQPFTSAAQATRSGNLCKLPG
jgi:hypothetical protein